MRAFVVDDEKPAREELTWLLSQCEGVEVIRQCASADEVVNALTAAAPELLFLDVDMPGLSGVRLAQWIADQPEGPRPLLIFVTAYEEHALDAFGLDAVDYLLKPVRLARLREAVTRARRRYDSLRAAAAPEPPPKAYLDRISVEELGAYRVIPTLEILSIEADEGFATVRTAAGEFLTDFTLKFLEENLDPAIFLRCHRSHIVRLDAITRIEPSGAGTYRLILNEDQDHPVPLARSRAPDLKARIPWSASVL